MLVWFGCSCSTVKEHLLARRRRIVDWNRTSDLVLIKPVYYIIVNIFWRAGQKGLN